MSGQVTGISSCHAGFYLSFASAQQLTLIARAEMNSLDLTLPTPAENLALDEALLDAAEADEAGETLRFWESPVPFVVLGYANRAATEANLPACAAASVPVLRRSSGGGTVLQGPGCFNYALILRITEAPPFHAINATNHFIMNRQRDALGKLLNGRVEVNGHTDLTLDGVKFSGNAQRRKRSFLLFHGTFLLNFDLPLIEQFLQMPTHQPAYRASRSHGEFLTNLNLPADTVKDFLRAAWEANNSMAAPPINRVTKLVADKYGSSAWNLKW